MTEAAQQALRRTMELYSSTTRLVVSGEQWSPTLLLQGRFVQEITGALLLFYKVCWFRRTIKLYSSTTR